MSIAPWRFAFKSIGDDWIKVVTGTVASVVILAISDVPIGKTHPWIPWLIFLVMWSWTWAWAFVKSWNRENRKVVILTREFVFPELQRVRHEASASSRLEFASRDSELEFYFQKLNCPSRGIAKDFLDELFSSWKRSLLTRRLEQHRG
jgi:hypothetical protein